MEGLGFSRPQDSLGTPGPHRMQIESHDNRAQRYVTIIAYGLGVLKWALNNIFSNHAQERGGIDRLLSERSVNDMPRQSESSALITGFTSTQKKAMASDDIRGADAAELDRPLLGLFIAVHDVDRSSRRKTQRTKDMAGLEWGGGYQ